SPTRRRGSAVVMLGTATLLGAGVLWFMVTTQAKGAGDRAASVAVKPFSAEMRLVVDREAVLAVESFRVWALAMAGVGLGLVLIGGIWRIWSGRQPDPFDTGAYASVQDWGAP